MRLTDSGTRERVMVTLQALLDAHRANPAQDDATVEALSLAIEALRGKPCA